MFSQYGEFQPTSGWDPLASLRPHSKFQRVSRFGSITAATSLTWGQPNFARCLAVSCAATLYIHFWGILPPNGILPCAKFTLCPSLAFSCIGSFTARHLVVGVSQTLRRWTEAATYIRQGGHHVGHWPTFLVVYGQSAWVKLSVCKYIIQWQNFLTILFSPS